MFVITTTGNLGKAPMLYNAPYEHYKLSVAAKAGWGVEAKTVWLNIKCGWVGNRSHKVAGLVKGQRVTVVVKVTGATDDGGFFCELLELHADRAPVDPIILPATEEMPF
jgi:hypothetical protein